MNFDEYQEQAMTTNLRPRVFTEQQVRNMLIRAYLRSNEDSYDLPREKAAEWADYDMDTEQTQLNVLVYPLLGLLEEAGELAGKVKKTIRDDNGVITEAKHHALTLESGDALWYLSAIADALDHAFSHVARENLTKLADRARRGVLQGSGDHR